ncbi:hypothetical protein [Actinopolyspora mortivallis]|nr:hypothetical protein [Actinopolyspora mortivallis]
MISTSAASSETVLDVVPYTPTGSPSASVGVTPISTASTTVAAP